MRCNKLSQALLWTKEFGDELKCSMLYKLDNQPSNHPGTFIYPDEMENHDPVRVDPMKQEPKPITQKVEPNSKDERSLEC